MKQNFLFYCLVVCSAVGMEDTLFRFMPGELIAELSNYLPEYRRAIEGACLLTNKNTDKTSNAIKDLQGHTAQITNLKFNFSGNKLLTCSADKTAIVWDLLDDKRKIFLHRDSVSSGKFSRDDTRIITIDGNNHIYLWDTNNGKELFNHPAPHNCFAQLSNDNNKLVCSSSDGMTIFKADDGKLFKEIYSCTSIRDAKFDLQSTYLLMQSWANMTTLIDVESTELKKHDFFVWNTADFSPDGEKIIASINNRIHIFEKKTGKTLMRLTLEPLQGPFFNPQLDIDGKKIFINTPSAAYSIQLNEQNSVHPIKSSIPIFNKFRRSPIYYSYLAQRFLVNLENRSSIHDAHTGILLTEFKINSVDLHATHLKANRLAFVASDDTKTVKFVSLINEIIQKKFFQPRKIEAILHTIETFNKYLEKLILQRNENQEPEIERLFNLNNETDVV